MNTATLLIYKSEIDEMADHDVQVPADGNFQFALVVAAAQPPPPPMQRRPSQIPEEASNTNPGQEKRSL